MVDRFNGPYIVIGDIDQWHCERNFAALEKEQDQVIATWHICPCGCRIPRRLPVNRWSYNIDGDGRLTLNPSILDTMTCKAHYFIKNGMVEFC